MAEPARKHDPVYDPEENDHLLGAQERANKRWGLNSPKEESGAEQSAGDEEGGENLSARDRASKSWGMSPDEIKEAEDSADGPQSSRAADFEADHLADRVGSGYKDEGKSLRQKLRGGLTRRRIIGGGLIGGTVGLLIGMFTIMSGPAQFIHIAQLLQRFHMTGQEDAGDDRSSKIYRFIRHPGKIERTRLGFLGNRYADKIETKLRQSGIASGYTNNLRYFNGYIIDIDRLPEGSDLNDLKNKSPAEIEAELTKKYKLPAGSIEIESGTRVKIRGDKLGYFKSRNMIESMLKSAGYSKVQAAIRTRIMGQRAGIDWHPMKKLDRKVLTSVDARLKEWRKKRQNRIDNGSYSGTTQRTPKKDADGNDIPPSSDEVDVDDRTRAAIGEGVETNTGIIDGDGPASLEKFRASTKLKIAGGISAAIGILCTAKALADNFDNVKHAVVVLPLIRMAMEAITVGNQVMSNNDVDVEQLGFYSKQLSGELEEDGGSWTNAKSIQAELGQEQTGRDIPEAGRIPKDDNAIAKVVNAIPGLGAICKAANSIFGQLVGFAVDIVGGPISAIAGTGLGFLLGPLLNSLTSWLAGHPIDVNIRGANFGNYINHGARLAANDSFIAAGGGALTGTELVQLESYQAGIHQQKLAEKSFIQRYFDIYDSDSLAAKLIDKQSPSMYTNLARFSSSLSNTNLLSSLSKSLFSPFSSKAYAATEKYDYGFPEYGFSIDELNSADVENPFENANEVVRILDGPRGGEFKERAQKCFGINLTADGPLTSQNSVPAYHEIPDNCRENDTDWLRTRFYIFDTQLMESTACYEGDDEACQNVGFTTTVASDSGSDQPDPTVALELKYPPNLADPVDNEFSQGVYFQMPVSPQGIYGFAPITCERERWGGRKLIGFLYTVSLTWKGKHPDNPLLIGDLNADNGEHNTHLYGRGVDLYSTTGAINMTKHTVYNRDQAIELGKIMLNTGIIKNIWFHDQVVIDALKKYAADKKLPYENMRIEFKEGADDHFNHWHVDINDTEGPRPPKKSACADSSGGGGWWQRND